MRTRGGQEILAIRWTGVQHEITWLPTHTTRKVVVAYYPDQEFDMALDGAPITQEADRMAQKVNIVVTSDLSEAEGASTVLFGLDGTTYEIDLTDKEQAALRKALAQYVGAGRKVKGAPGRVNGTRRGSGRADGGPSPASIREWATAQGLDVPARGRIPQEVRDQYDAAH
jgi:hypothetical protein